MDNSPENKKIENQLDNLGVTEEKETSALAEKEFTFLGDPTKTVTPKKQEKSLFKKLRPIIALALIAVILIGGFGIMRIVLPDESADIEELEKEDVIELTEDISGTSATRVEIKNSLDEFAFVRRLEKTYYIEGRADLPVSNATILSALTYAGSVTAVTEVDKKVTDWEEYGLKEPVATVKWIKGDYSHYFELGDIAPSGNYYMRFNGGDTVYTYDLASANMFITARMDYYDTSVFAFDAKTDGPYITEFTIFNRKMGETLVAELQDLTAEELGLSAYVMSAPIEHNFSVEKFDAISALMGNLTSLTVFSDDISDANLEKYGLIDPDYVFTFTNVAVKNVFRIGVRSDEGYYYAYAEGKPFIYIIDEEVMKILTYDVATYCDLMSYSRSYDTIDTLKITGGGKTYDIDIVGTSEESNLQAYINNKFVEYENFGSLYAHIISIDVSEVGTKPEGATPLVTIEVNCLDGTKDILKYYKISELKSFFELNGEGRLIVPTSKVEQILTFSQQLYDGQEIVLDW